MKKWKAFRRRRGTAPQAETQQTSVLPPLPTATSLLGALHPPTRAEPPPPPPEPPPEPPAPAAPPVEAPAPPEPVAAAGSAVPVDRVVELLSRFGEHLSPVSRQAYRKDLTTFGEFCGAPTAEALATLLSLPGAQGIAVLDAWDRSSTLSPATRRRRLAAVKAFLRAAQEEGLATWVPKNVAVLRLGWTS